MSNKISGLVNSNLLENKLSVLFEELNTYLQTNKVSEKEDILIRFNYIINTFYNTLTSPIFSPKRIKAGLTPDYRELNKYFAQAEQDLIIIYKEINSLHSYIVSNFNTLQTISSALRARIRRTLSDLTDYRLQSQDLIPGAVYYSDTFSSSERIDYSNNFYSEEKCSLDTNIGQVTLPVNPKKITNYNVQEINIGAGSNGFPGNNHQLEALARNNLKAIVDGNTDSWFEYERVTNSASTTPLVLELKLELEKDSIVNNLSIYPVSFATRSYAKIINIETSLDGKATSSLFDDISSDIFKDQNNKFILLTPESNKFSGITNLVFPPRKIRYLTITLQQDEAYLIETSSGLRFRKAIGLRGIDIIGKEYLSRGEIVSSLYSLSSEAKKIALKAETVEQKDLSSIQHFITANNGQTWLPIQSITKNGISAPEILNFNLESIDSIKTNSPVTEIRYKALLERTPSNFGAKGGTEKRRDHRSDFLSITAGTKTIPLVNIPIKNTLAIKNLAYGSVGRSEALYIPIGSLLKKDSFLWYYLPSNPFAPNSIPVDAEIISINNEKWTRVPSLSVISGQQKVYEFDYLNNIIKFGDNTNGKHPDGDIYFKLKREQVLIEGDNPHKIKTKFSTDGIKENIQLYRLEKETEEKNHILPKGATRFSLEKKDITEITVVTDTSLVLNVLKPFIDGVQELENSGDYSIDYINGIIYSKDTSSEYSDLIIDYKYRNRVIITPTITNGELFVSDSDFITVKKAETITVGAPTKVIRLSNKKIKERSIRFVNNLSLFKTEIPISVDWNTLGLSDLSGYYKVDYENGIIYTYSGLTTDLLLEYNYYEYYIEYNIAVLVPVTSYTINSVDNTIVFSDAYVSQNFYQLYGQTVTRTMFRIEYDYITEVEQSFRELENYFTPFLNEYSLIVITDKALK